MVAIFENLRGFAISRPPLVLFMTSLAAFAVVLMTLAYCIKVRQELVNPDYTEDWNKFLQEFTSLEFCMLESNTSADMSHLVPQKEQKLKTALSGLHDKLPGSQGASTATTPNPTASQNLNEAVSISVSMMVAVEPTADFLKIPHNVTQLSTTMKGHQMGLEGIAADLEMNVSLSLPFEWNKWNITHCPKGQCPPAKIYTCINFQAPSQFFPRSRKPETCYGINETGVEYHTKMVGVHKNLDPKKTLVCQQRSMVRVEHKIDPTLTVMLSVHDRSVINLHLLHTSYFLFVMVITMFCYAIVKGRTSKNGHSSHGNKTPQYTEMTTEA